MCESGNIKPTHQSFWKTLTGGIDSQWKVSPGAATTHTVVIRSEKIYIIAAGLTAGGHTPCWDQWVTGFFPLSFFSISHFIGCYARATSPPTWPYLTRADQRKKLSDATFISPRENLCSKTIIKQPLATETWNLAKKKSRRFVCLSKTVSNKQVT